MKLIVGLGNPGNEYARHRHNVGFMALERMTGHHRLSAWRRRFQGETSDGEIDGRRVVLLKPATFMNDSGRSVGEAARFLKIEPADIIVLHDELDLAPGKLKVKTGGGNAGHNGLKSISAHLGNDYVRVRIGIGHPGHKDAVSGYVLHDFAKVDREWLEPMLDAIARAAGRLAAGDNARFLTDVARMTGDDTPIAPPPPAERRAAPAPKPTASRSTSHPAGERMGKRQNALGENLRKWLSRRKSED